MRSGTTSHPEAAYHVRFFRTETNDAGKCARCVLDTVEIRRARSSQRALSAAQHRFQRKFGLDRWDQLAHGFQIDRHQ